jgi:hydrogenase maturation protease
MKTEIALMGLGNILLRDEGVGVHVVNGIREHYTFSPPVQLIDGGTLGFALLPFFEEFGKILIVDAVDFGKAPGHIEALEDDRIPSVFLPKLSVHHIGLCDVLFAVKLMDLNPEKICLIGIQPGSTDVGLEMTETIESALGTLTDLIIMKLKAWNVTCALQCL